MSRKLRISGHKLYNIFNLLKKALLRGYVLKFPYILYRIGEYKYLNNYRNHLEMLVLEG